MGVEDCVAWLKAKAAWKWETSSKEDKIHQPRENKARRDKPKGRRGLGEMHSTT